MSLESKKTSIAHIPKHCATILGVIAAIVIFLLGTKAILNSASSTAAIGFIILPFYAVIVLVIFAFIGFWVGVIAQGVLDRNFRYKPRFFLGIIIIIPVMFYFASYGSELFITYREVNRITHMNTQELNQAYLSRPQHSLYGYDIYILAAIAQNPNTGSDLLNNIAHLDDPRLNDRLGSMLMDLTKKNRKGLAVMRLVVHNPNVSLDTLVYLTNSNNYNVLGDLASNPKLPVNELRKLYERARTSGEGYLIDWDLAYNPNTPQDILRELAKKIKPDAAFDPIDSALKNNPSTPEDVRALLKQ